MKTNGNSPNGNGGLRMCVSCGEKSVSTHRIYQSLVRKFDDKDNAALKGTAGRCLRIIGHDRKEIATIDGVDAKADEYAQGMNQALKGTHGEMFERKRNNGEWSWLVALLLGCVSAVCCGDGENRRK